MKLIYKEKDESIEAVQIECTAEEYLFLAHVMRRYAHNPYISDSKRDVMKQMLEVKPVIKEVNKMNDCKDCKQEAKNEPPSAISEEDLSKAFVLGLTFGFGETHDEMDSIKKAIKQTFTPVKKIRAEIASHCSLIKDDHCKFCSSCHCLMGVREILDILDKNGGMEE